ncbi:hypothetical protein CEXT_443001 [Caerostris extrusa]|uniref:Uncharacterized protein n=1 Tax=Caerostris extrusa TaxID=172846 RepID=A0AAV4NNN5_CAEEX|nr:hypothetical protein CEXT_443001 [Caerostris extrusa]
MTHLKVLVRVTRKCNRQKSFSFVQNGQNILSDASSSETCFESSLEDELQKFDPYPEHLQNNRSLNGILQDRITGIWIVQKGKISNENIGPQKTFLFPQGQREPFGHTVIDFTSRSREARLAEEERAKQ